jgi:hypothetical protein
MDTLGESVRGAKVRKLGRDEPYSASIVDTTSLLSIRDDD